MAEQGLGGITKRLKFLKSYEIEEIVESHNFQHPERHGTGQIEGKRDRGK